MGNQLTVRLSHDEFQRLEQVHSLLHQEEKYRQSRSSVLRRLIAMACDVVLDSREQIEAV